MADESQLDHLIDPAFRRGDGYNDSAIPAILMPKKKHKGDKQPKPVVLPQTRVERRLSKSQERKLKKLEVCAGSQTLVGWRTRQIPNVCRGTAEIGPAEVSFAAVMLDSP